MRLARFERRAAVAKSESDPPPTHPVGVWCASIRASAPKPTNTVAYAGKLTSGDGHERFSSTLEVPLRGLAPATS
jgi:hypothetical protein